MSFIRWLNSLRPARHAVANAAASTFLMSLLVAGLAFSEQIPSPYLLGPEDVITVTVSRHPEFSGDFYVPNDGNLSLPSIGQITAAGKTMEQMSLSIANGLRDRLRDPEVTVTLKTPRMQRVYVLGAVGKPGSYDMKPGWRITEAIAGAGGIASGTEPAECAVTILRANGKRFTLKLADVLSGSQEANKPIESGDSVTVEAQETMPVYVMGKVKNPGLYRIRKDNAGVMEALTLAGGSLEDSALSHVTITHLNGPPEVADLGPAILQGKSGANPRLNPGDLVTVPEETSRVAVLGYVNQPGFYPLKRGQKLTLTDALGLAKGVDNKRGKLGQVAVIRAQDGKQGKLVFDLRKFLKSADLRQNPELLPGDVVYVPGGNQLDWDTVLRSLSSFGLLLGPLR
jgi:polysaccharide biosynthesis/export protein